MTESSVGAWEQALRQARRHGLQGLLAHRHALAPGPWQAWASRAYQEQFLLNTRLLGMLEVALRALRPQKVEVIALKGAALLGTVYPELGLRPLSDIDLMVRAEDLAFAEACLSESGFYRQSAMNYQWQGLSLDLHVDLTSAHRIRARERLYAYSLDEIWARAVPHPRFDGLLRLQAEDEFIHLAVHALKHGHSRQIWAVDLERMLAMVDTEQLWLRADRYGCRRPLLYAFHWIGRPVADDLKWWERAYLARVAGGYACEPLAPWMCAALLPDWRDRLTFLRECLWPRNEVLRELYPGARGWQRVVRRAGDLGRRLAEIVKREPV